MAKKNLNAPPRTKNGEPGSHAKTRATTSSDILQIVGRVTVGLENENSSLDAIVAETNELATSLEATAKQAASVANSSEETASSTNQIAASIEQVTANLAQVATS